MNGLQQIISAIDDSGKKQTEAIIDEAKNTAAKIIKDAEDEANNEARVIIAEAQKKAEVIIENAQKEAGGYKSKKLLSVKTEKVDSAIKNAAQALNNLSDEEYFALLKKLSVKYALSEEGELVVDKNDLPNVPKDFIKDINDTLSERNACLTLKGEENIGKGLILRYGGIEENCTFLALINEKSDEIKDKLFSLIK